MQGDDILQRLEGFLEYGAVNFDQWNPHAKAGWVQRIQNPAVTQETRQEEYNKHPKHFKIDCEGAVHA